LWLIEIDNKRNAKHTLNISLANTNVPTPTQQEYIAIAFSPTHPLEEFRVKVDGNSLPDNYGFNQPDRTWGLKIEEITRFSQKPAGTSSFKIEVAFQQTELAHKTMDMNLVELGINTNLLPSSIKLVFGLPKYVGILSKLNYYLNVLRKRNRDKYEIAPYQVSALQPAEYDRRKGAVFFNTAKEIKAIDPIRFSYRPVGKVDWPSLVSGLIFGVIGGVIVEIIIRLVLPLFGVNI
jgi:hypothetical protein